MTSRPTAVLREVIRTVARGDSPDVTDRELLRRFAADHDQNAFALLVARHTGMVLGVCRRLLPTVQDAEDAVQATFLLLAQKAASVRWQSSAANWLYTTARKLARNARVVAQRRAKREAHVAERNSVQAMDRMTARDLLEALDAELDRLPAIYREALVLCYLEGLTRDEAAARLGVPPATLKTRTERGRKRLHDALTRGGITLGAGLLALAATSPARASPPRLVHAILAAASGAVPEAVAELAKGVAMNGVLNKSLPAVLVLIGVAALGIGLGSLTSPAADPPAEKPAPASPDKGQGKDASKESAVAGRVLDPDGKPVARAAVYLFAWKKARPPAEPVQIATTDADGRFHYDTGRMPPGVTGTTLAAVADGFASDWGPLKGGETEMTLRLAPEVPIRGRLVDLEGKPVAGAVAKLQAVGAFADGNLQPALNAMRLNPEWLNFEKGLTPLAPVFTTEVKTDKEGRFELKGVGRDRVAILRFHAPGIEAARVHVVTQKDFDPKIVLPKPNEKEMVSEFVPGLRLAVYGPSFTHSAKPSHDITGTVTDAVNGKPIPNVTVVGDASPASFDGNPHWGNSVETKTDRNGQFLLSGLPKAGRRFLHLQPGDNPYLDQLVEVKDIQGLAPVAIKITLDRCVLIEGQIKDKVTGKPVLGEAKYFPMLDNPALQDKTDQRTRLYQGGLSSANPTGTWADTDGEGRFRLRVLRGPGVVLARADTERDPAACYTAIRVAEADRKYLSKKNPDAISSTRPPNAKTRDRSEDDETFATYEVGWPLRWENGYALINPGEKDDAVKVEIRFDPGQSVTGKVVGPDGEPVAGAKAIGTRATDEMKPTRLSGTKFAAHALAPDRPREMFFIHEEKKLVGTVTLRAGDKEPVVKLQPWAVITGRVLNPDGTPAANAEISFQFVDGLADELVRQKLYWDRSWPAARTDQEGRFQLEGMFPELEVMVGANAPGLRAGTVSNPVIPKSGEVVDVGDLKLPASRDAKE